MKRHLLSVLDLNEKEIEVIFEKAEGYLKNDLSQILAGEIVTNVFFENSTRTLTSFEIAAKKLGAQVINVCPEFSSIKKGESIADTLTTLRNINPDFIVIRSPSSGIPFTAVSECSTTINAGDGSNEHPTQALIDAFTIKSLKGRIKGIKVAICGDIRHSRVAHSNIKLLSMLGAEICLVSPPTLTLPYSEPSTQTFTSPKQSLKNADVVMVLRVQIERGSYIPSKAEYYKIYGIDGDKLSYAKSDAIVMHPGPINRGVEISSEVADNNHSAILKQVEFSIPVRQAVFDFFNT